MQLDCAQKENGTYWLSRDDIEQVAVSVLKEYSPHNLECPAPLNTAGLLEDYLGLTVKRKYIGTMESGILGLIVMSDIAEIPSYDDMFRQTVLEETYGTVLISACLTGMENVPRRRYTEAHEGSHYLLHRPYYQKLEEISGCKTANPSAYIACRKVELHEKKPKNDIEWLEWQADTLAASLLMPKDIFYFYVRSVIRRHGISRGYLIAGAYPDKRQARDIISEIAGTFHVSYRATQIRMLHLGLIKQQSVCYAAK